MMPVSSTVSAMMGFLMISALKRNSSFIAVPPAR
jgi:hypothetical protein